LYRAQDRLDLWQATLEEYLEQPVGGLEPARVRVDLARHYMGRQEPAKARPYAEKAAETGAEWARRCAEECLEQLGEWAAAEAGQEGDRDAALKTYPADAALAPLARLLRDHFKAAGGGLDAKEVEAAVARAVKTEQADAWYVVGRLLAHEGRKEDALACWRRC